MKPAVKIVRGADRTYRAWCPALPGCAVYAERRERTQSRAGDAVVGCLPSTDLALPKELGPSLVAGDAGPSHVPASSRAGSTTRGGDRSCRREDCHART